MKVVIYDKLSSRPIRELRDGVEASGDCPVLQNPNVWDGTVVEDADCIVLNGLNAVMAPIYRRYLNLGVPVYIIEQGHTGRPQPNAGHVAEVEYWQLGPMDLNWLPPFPCPDDRRESLGIAFPGTTRNPDGPILFIGQKPGDAQTWAENLYRWHSDAMACLREHTDREFIYRPHPLDLTGKLPWHDSFSVQDTERTSLDDALSECFAAITFNSNAGFKALLRGVPVFCDPRAIYAAPCKRPGPEIIEDYEYDEAVWTDTLNRMCYAQWSTDELASGEAWQWIKQAQDKETTIYA